MMARTEGMKEAARLALERKLEKTVWAKKRRAELKAMVGRCYRYEDPQGVLQRVIRVRAVELTPECGGYVHYDELRLVSGSDAFQLANHRSTPTDDSTWEQLKQISDQEYGHELVVAIASLDGVDSIPIPKSDDLSLPLALSGSADQVNFRIDAWHESLMLLFNQIRSWAAEIEDCVVHRTLVMQRLEGPMKEHDVQPRLLPQLEVWMGETELRFVSSAIWIIGADGRVNILFGNRHWDLVDLRDADQPDEANWMWQPERCLGDFEQFDEAAFRTLIGAE